jgi:hypothetical protein
VCRNSPVFAVLTSMYRTTLQALVSMQLLEKDFQYQYYMHADDDSYVRLDLVMKLLVSTSAVCQEPLSPTAGSRPFAHGQSGSSYFGSTSSRQEQ